VCPFATLQILEEEAKRADQSAYEEPSDCEQRKRKGAGSEKAAPPDKKAKH
jgi:hypothetical protein